MLPSKFRLKGAQKPLIFQRARTYASKLFLLRLGQLSPGEESKFAFVVGSKKVKKAVIRNKIKRRAREIIRKKLPFIKNGNFAIFIFTADCAKATFKDMEGEICAALEKAKLV